MDHGTQPGMPNPSPNSSKNWKVALVAVEAGVATAVASFFGIGGVTALAAAVALGGWGMSKLTGSKVGSSSSSSSSMPLSTRKQKLAEAEQKFGVMFPAVRNISAGEAHQILLEQPARYVLVDVRNPEEQQVSKVAGVLTVTEFEQQRETLQDATAICLCTVGYRSSKYAASLLDNGQKAVNLQGGILAWTHTGLPLVDGSDPQQPSRRVHTYAQEWAFQADGYEPVYYSHSRFMMVWDVLRSVARKLIGMGG